MAPTPTPPTAGENIAAATVSTGGSNTNSANDAEEYYCTGSENEAGSPCSPIAGAPYERVTSPHLVAPRGEADAAPEPSPSRSAARPVRSTRSKLPLSSSMCGFKGSVSWWLWMGSSIIFALAAIISALCWSSIIDALIASLLVLSPSSQTYQRWVAPDQPLYFEIFMFNWTNADRYPEKPKLEQLGPYRFREVRKHVNVTFQPHNSSVAYRTQRTWYFDSTTSNGSLQDPVTSINMPTASALYNVRNSLLTPGVNKILKDYNSGLSVFKTVGELLFEGYEDQFLNIANQFSPEGVPKPDRFGWFYERNNSIETDGYMEVSTGAGDSVLGQVLKWNYEDSIPVYRGKCARLTGSAGEFMTRSLTENSTLTMFVPDLCRTVDLEHVASGELEGLEYHKFEMLERCFDNSSVSQENTCFCNGDCKWSGVMNVSSCRYDTPSFLSLPHFLHGDPRLREAVEGMAPDPDKHSFYFSVEPTFGVPLDVAARFQFNVHLTPWDSFVWFFDTPYVNIRRDLLLPVFWVQQHVKVTENIFKELRIARAVAEWGGLVLAIIGLICGAVAVICSSRKPKYIFLGIG